MKNCPYCLEPPRWHYARNTSWTRKVDHFAFTGCAHVTAFVGRAVTFIPHTERADTESKWDAQAEKLFADYTAKWTEPQRISFRARLWPVPPPVVPTELFDRRHDERPIVGETEDADKGSF